VSFRFDRSWELPLTPDELWTAIDDPARYPAWWPWLREFDLDALTEGTVTSFVVRPPAPYRMRFVTAIEQVVPPELIAVTIDGDVSGRARLTIEPSNPGSTARIVWELQARRPLLRVLERLARPVLVRNHDRVVDDAVAQFVRAVSR
jgi:uncharacterized protein YndB with AHSA1/START domain